MNIQKNVRLKNSSGFSLVELMVVVAIIGILASVAVPQFQKFTFKARMTEAKAGLTSLYTAEKAFYGEWSEFDTRFQVIGYAPEGNYSFNIGFAGANVVSANWTTSNPVAPAVVQNNTNTFCAPPSTRCKNMQTSNVAITSPGAGFLGGASPFAGAALVCTATNAVAGGPGFKACASASAAINPEGVQVRLAINHSKDLRSDVP